MTHPPIVLYNYSASPFGQKVELVLLLKRLPYSKVKVPMTLPRPQLAMLGVTYRKNPVLAIGNDIFFDSYLACLALERTFPKNPVFSPHEGVQRAMSFFWSDRAVFILVPALLDYAKLGPVFLKDREAFRGGIPINPEEELKGRPGNLSAIRSQFDLLEAQLAGRSSSSNYVLDTPTPTFLDISIFIILDWITVLPASSPLYDAPSAKHPLSVAWTAQIRSHLATLKPLVTIIKPEEGARLVLSSPPTPIASYKSDDYEPLLKEGLKIGEWAETAPNDSGKVPQKGVLVAINSEVVVLEVESAEKGKFVRCLAPRLASTVRPIKGGLAKI